MATFKEGGSGTAALNWAARFASSWIPNLYRQPRASTREAWQVRAIWGETPGAKVKHALNRAVQRTELPGTPTTVPLRDHWGKPIPSGKSPWDYPATDIPWRMLSPMTTEPAEKPEDADLMMAAWNRQHPDAPYKPGRLRRSYQVTVGDVKETRYLNDEQFDFYAKTAGELALEYVRTVPWDTTNPKPWERKKIAKLIAAARRRARIMTFQEFGIGRWAPAEADETFAVPGGSNLPAARAEE